MQLRDLLEQAQAPALLIGNGINRYQSKDQQNSWDDLLRLLAQRHLKDFSGSLPSGISLTEFYDILDLRLGATRANSKRRKLHTSTSASTSSTMSGLSQASKANVNKPKAQSLERSLQQQFCDLMSAWTPLEQHRYIMHWARARQVPVLTTNFEHSLSQAIDARFFFACANGDDSQGFTDFYPWEAYFSDRVLEHPCAGFGIWHVNGMQRYHRSIRLGLSHYMGSVERARTRLHKGAQRLSAGTDPQQWSGASTWLHILFHKPLLIFGLGLGENEVFLRWLLIERARYFMNFPKRFQPAWYVHPKGEKDSGKLYFLQAVGVQACELESYDALYGAEAWRTF
ncbi:hypothetical protein RF679_14455 [Undibacterium cyanobacteriorum]|uniref:SIR2-like domain-containing protein n=1 Tax=Undibacterium cyanobacteriorum TaxID=3073561 RepID=A0ABY9RF28_9BURK|nr:hypothetical protein [Undibacterium sp. 20NA77.5]WMW79837.1 hypothetical protein RF679_14455 [Undibacterium sp. 20NA77.5]